MIEKIKKYKFFLGFAAILIVAIVIPLTISQLGKNQESRSHASGGAVSVVLQPLTQTFAPNAGTTVQVNLNGADNNVSAADITFSYNTDVPGTTVTFQPALTFTTIQNVNSNGSIHFVGVNPSSASISGSLINIGSLQINASSPGTITIGFTNVHVNASGVTTALPLDTANTKVGTYIIGTGTNASASPTLAPTATTVPTATPTPPSVTNANGQTTVLLSIKMVGIGSSSTNGLNNNPKTPQRTVQVSFFNSQNQNVSSTTGVVNFDSSSGLYKGTITTSNLTTGPYTVKVKLDNTLFKQIPGIQNIVVGNANQTTVTTLIAGDLNGDNEINLIDYNLMLACLRHSDACLAN